MKIRSLKFAIAAISIIAFALILKSCKKVDNSGTGGLSSQDLADIRQKLTNQGIGISTIINQKADRVYYVNKNGDTINVKAEARPANGLSVPCDGLSCTDEDATGDDDPSELASLDVTLESCTRTVGICPSGFTANTLAVTWKIAAPYNLLTSNMLNHALLSKGKIYITNAAGTTIYSNSSITPITITSIGADPNCSARNLFEVSYNLAGIPDADFSMGYTLYNGMSCFTDCDVMANMPINYQAAYAWPIPATVNTPCNRVDKVSINAPILPNNPTAIAFAIGNGAFGCSPNSYPTGWQAADLQHLEYWKNSTPSTVYMKDLTYLAVYPMPQVTKGSGAWTIRYRNHMNTPAPNGCDGPWMYEYWTF